MQRNRILVPNQVKAVKITQQECLAGIQRAALADSHLTRHPINVNVVGQTGV
jgi:hypothetical protein